MSIFRKAERKKSKLRLALVGPSGSGKTMSALKIAKGISDNIALLDTESGSGDLYAHLFDYSVARLDAPFSPERYIEIIREAEKAGIGVLIIDSLSHAWSHEGGVCSMAENSTNKNEMGKWLQPKRQQKMLMQKILSSSIHIICTMRTKTEYLTAKNANGKNVTQKVALAPIQEKDIDYDFTCVLELEQDGNIAKCSKDRTNIFKGLAFTPDEETGEKLLGWLMEGKDDTEMLEREDRKKNLLSAMEECSEFEDLLKSYKESIGYAKEISDKDFYEEVVRVKDLTKARIEWEKSDKQYPAKRKTEAQREEQGYNEVQMLALESDNASTQHDNR